MDDFVISGGTLIALANMLKAHGAKRIFSCVSHTLLNPEGVERLNQSCVERLLTTDTVYCPLIAGNKKIHVLSSAPLFAESIIRIQIRQSISSLFNTVPEKVLDELF